MDSKKSIQIFICWKVFTDHSTGCERTKVISGNLLIREVLVEGGNSYFFTASLEIQFLIFPSDFELDIINSFAVF